MSFFDYYEPVPALACVWCGSPIAGWEGYDGPGYMFVWRQGSRVSVGQRADEEWHFSPDDLAQFSLPQSFTIEGVCAGRHRAIAQCTTVADVWSSTDVNWERQKYIDDCVEEDRWRRSRP